MTPAAVRANPPADLDLDALDAVLAEVTVERARQVAKWGRQDHPWIDPFVGDLAPHARAAYYGLPLEDDARRKCQNAARLGRVSFLDILVEELAEAVGANTPDAVRAELVQTAAVVVAAIEALDRREARP